jgi:sugar lactone lactonase YvrE
MSRLLVRIAAAGAGVLLAGCGGETEETPPDCSPGNACDWANHSMKPGDTGDGDPIRDSRLYFPVDLEFAPDGTPWVLDWNNHKIRKVVDGKFQTTVGMFIGDGDPELADLTPAGADPLLVSLNHPTDLAFKPDGTLIIAAWHNHKIRVLDATTNKVHVACGRGYGYKGDGGQFDKALLNQPKSVVLTKDGTLYILDQRNERIRKVDPITNVITTVAGTGERANDGSSGIEPLQAKFNFENETSPNPSGAMVLDSEERVYISDGTSHRIRRIDFKNNVIETIAGTGTAGFSGDGGAAISAQINNARDLEFGPDGRLYIADTDNHRIRAIDLTTGIITTVAGTGNKGAGKEGQPATKVDLDHPYGIAFDKAGALYIADSFNNRILKVAR